MVQRQGAGELAAEQVAGLAEAGRLGVAVLLGKFLGTGCPKRSKLFYTCLFTTSGCSGS